MICVYLLNVGFILFSLYLYVSAFGWGQFGRSCSLSGQHRLHWSKLILLSFVYYSTNLFLLIHSSAYTVNAYDRR